MPNRQLRLPTRAELSVVPSMSWVYLALAAATVALRFAFPSNEDGPLLLVGAFASAGPAVVAAALVYVAPRQRLIQVSAACFAIPLAMRDLAQVFASGGLFSFGADTRDWALLGERLNDWLNALNSIGWMFGIAAVVALAVYVGPVRSRRGWLIVAVGLALSALKMAVVIGVLVQQSDQLGLIISETPPALLFSPAAQLVILAWAYLLAVAYDRRHVLLSVAAAAQLSIAAISLFISTVLASWLVAGPDGDSTGVMLVLVVESVLQIGSLAALTAGILRELPRAGRTAPTAPAKQEPVAA